MSSWFMSTVEASSTEWSLQTRGVKEDGKQTNAPETKVKSRWNWMSCNRSRKHACQNGNLRRYGSDSSNVSADRLVLYNRPIT